MILEAFLLLPLSFPAQDPAVRDRAERALRRATDFFRREVAAEGGYLWRYSDDLERREGEGKASATMAWVQPPGTPSIGLVYLHAFDMTGDRNYLEAARETAMALVRGQLRSGGWDYRIEFDPKRRGRYAYRSDKGSQQGRNVTTLDDNTTQSATQFLIRVDQALDFKDEPIHEAMEFALSSLLKAQYPNGGWPQRYDRFPDLKEHPVKKARFPESWSRAYQKKDYRGHYTFNDGLVSDLVDTLMLAFHVTGGGRYRAAAEKAGDFILLAQMPDPQPGWAQQYDRDMHPAWARRFEPPSITGGESQGVMRTLLHLYRETGKKRFLEPLPRAIAYYRRSRLKDGSLARFYELRTNRPLYFTKKYELTYSDADLPTHYGFKIGNRLDSIEREFERLRKNESATPGKPPKRSRPKFSRGLESRAKSVISALDDRGRWVVKGRLKAHGSDDPTRRIIDCRTFIRNVGILSDYLAATK